MKLKDITVGLEVTVTRGYSRRPARVTDIHDGKVGVSFTDTAGVDTRGWASTSNFFGATVRPNQIEATS